MNTEAFTESIFFCWLERYQRIFKPENRENIYRIGTKNNKQNNVSRWKPRYSRCPHLLKISGENSQNWNENDPLEVLPVFLGLACTPTVAVKWQRRKCCI